MDFKDRIKLLREEKKLTHTRLANDFNKSEAAVRAWETGRTKPDADTLIALAKYFGCSADYILGLDDNRNKETFETKSESLQEIGGLLNELAGSPERFLAVLHFMLLWPKVNDVPELIKYLEIIINNLGKALLTTSNVFDKYRKNEYDLMDLLDMGRDVDFYHKTVQTALSLYCLELFDFIGDKDGSEQGEKTVKLIMQQYDGDRIAEYINNIPEMAEKHNLYDFDFADVFTKMFAEENTENDNELSK